ncbi:hypothetical protein VL14_14920 [Cytobacillus firmus]|nr:hypothetical protein VL14_14920 [Cytobacillus firmus]
MYILSLSLFGCLSFFALFWQEDIKEFLLYEGNTCILGNFVAAAGEPGQNQENTGRNVGFTGQH